MIPEIGRFAVPAHPADVDLTLFPARAGTYSLILRLDRAARSAIGALGTVDLPAGRYAYVGSAFGPGGLRGRLAHHIRAAARPPARPHWHIDYLWPAAHLIQIVYAVGPQRLEHTWAGRLIAAPGAFIPAPRFGASDCRCPAHLIGLPPALDPGAWLAGAALQPD
ncbi:MAG: GIY-YIG nuclease family protein [Candidatus Flexifilum sp.]|jgi:Uri superfamily endonuclease